jgi:hypothetical protein
MYSSPDLIDPEIELLMHRNNTFFAKENTRFATQLLAKVLLHSCLEFRVCLSFIFATVESEKAPIKARGEKFGHSK